MEISVDIEEVEKFISSDDFSKYLLDKTDIGVAAFILQSLLDAVDKAKET
jgi:hypothetical protein